MENILKSETTRAYGEMYSCAPYHDYKESCDQSKTDLKMFCFYHQNLGINISYMQMYYWLRYDTNYTFLVMAKHFAFTLFGQF